MEAYGGQYLDNNIFILKVAILEKTHKDKYQAMLLENF